MPSCMFVVTLPKQLDSDLDPAHLLVPEEDDDNEVLTANAGSNYGSDPELINDVAKNSHQTGSSSDAGIVSSTGSDSADGSTTATTAAAVVAAASGSAESVAFSQASDPQNKPLVSGEQPSKSALRPPQSPLSDRHVAFNMGSVNSANNAMELAERRSSATSNEGVDSVDFDWEAANQRSVQRVERMSRKQKRPLTPTEITRMELEYFSLNYTLTPMSKGLFIQIICLCPAKTAEVLHSRLVYLGIGRRHNTSVNLFNPTLSRTGVAGKASGDQDDDEDADGGEESGRMQAFITSMRARLMVSQVYRSVMDKGRWTFDFVCFLVCAGVIAAVGLATNSSVMTVASMLLSPYMGPILALTFSWRLKRGKAALQCAYNTLLATGIIFLTGFLMLFVLIGPLLLLGVEAFPTKEMTDRGQHASLLFGIIVASASAYGVSVSVLQGDHSANVGVAISASLLPPVVNSGMLLAYCIMAAFRPPTLIGPSAALQAAAVASASNATAAATLALTPPNCIYQHFNQFEFAPVYVCSVTSELLIMSAQSTVLSLLNIVLIVLCSYFWLALKEVVPDKTERSDANREFYSYDIRYARDNHDCLHGDSRTQLKTEFSSFLKFTKGQGAASREAAVEQFAEKLGDVFSDANYRTICATSKAGPLPCDPANRKQLARTLSVRGRRHLANKAAKQQQVELSEASSSGASLSERFAATQPPISPKGVKHGRFSVKSSSNV